MSKCNIEDRVNVLNDLQNQKDELIISPHEWGFIRNKLMTACIGNFQMKLRYLFNILVASIDQSISKC
jgi:hypothetical protein